MNLLTTLALYGTAAGTASEGSSLINNPDDQNNDIRVKDIARRRLVKTNPDVDAANPEQQSDNAGFVGKKYRVQDKHYGHYISEHDSSSSAEKAATARPYSRVLHAPEWSQTQESRDAARRKLMAGGPGSGRHKQILNALGYDHKGTVKEGNIKADMFQHHLSRRQLLLHSSGAWSTKKGGMIDNGTNMHQFYSHYHLNAGDQAIWRGRVQ